MKLVFLTLYVCVVFCQALDCGISKYYRDEQFQNVLVQCISNNQTLNEIKNLLNANYDEDSSMSSDEVGEKNGSSNSTKNINRRSINDIRSPVDSKKSNFSDTETVTTSTEPIEKDPPECMWKCIFEKYGLTTSEGLPDYQKLVNSLPSTNMRKELRDFFQDSINECFQEIQKANIEETCEYSTKLLLCLAEKGRRNCDDWPIGNLTIA